MNPNSQFAGTTGVQAPPNSSSDFSILGGATGASTGTFANPDLTSKVNTTGNIDTSKLGAQDVTVPPTQTNTTGSFVNSLQVGNQTQGLPPAQDLQNNVNKAQGETDQTTKEIQDLMTQLGMKSQDTTDLQSKANLTGLTQQLTDLNTQYAQKKANYDAQFQKIGAQNIPSLFTSGQEALAHSAAASDLGATAAQIQAAQGNLNTAYSTIDKTISEKYTPIQNQIDAKLKFYELNKDKLTAAQSVLADKQKADLTAQKDKLTNEQKQQSDVTSLIKDEISKGKINAQSGINAIADMISGKTTVADALRSLNINPAQASDGGVILPTNSGGNVIGGVTIPSNVSAPDVKAVLEGRNSLLTIRQTVGRSKAADAKMQALRDTISKIDPNFDFVSSDAGAKSVSSAYVQRSKAAINSVLPNIDKIVELSDQVSRIGVKGVDKQLQNAAIQLGDQKVSNFHEAQKLIADEIGVALGAGSVSDMKLQLGFDVTDPSVSPEVFASNMGIVKEFIQSQIRG